MPYVLSPVICEDLEGMWGEGSPYKKEIIYSIDSLIPKSPPVNYSSYTLKPHSLPHIESAAHTNIDGKTIDWYFKNNKLQNFFGKTLVIKLKGNHFQDDNRINGTRLWEITLTELKQSLFEYYGFEHIPDRLLISLNEVPLNHKNQHDPNYVLILSKEAAEYLTTNENFSLYGTSWKSSDFNPGKSERPIHNTIFKRAVIMECLDLKNVPVGEYFICAFPIPLEGASESPVCPVLFTRDEIKL